MNTLTKFVMKIVVTLIIVGCASNPERNPQSVTSVNLMNLEMLQYDAKAPFVEVLQLRAGYFKENLKVPFKGCVLYLQGLADSVQNHYPLYQALSDNGYRTIFFDYMGQGGSQGTMNHTRVNDPILRSLEIGTQAKMVWDKYSAVINEKSGLSCVRSPKMVIGWSTGGLAAYKLAHDEWADAVVLIAPGINPKKFVGEAAQNPSLLFTLEPIISKASLTRNNFRGQTDPHIDPINPTSPTQVPLFASNLVLTAHLAQFWKINKKVSGMVFLSGDEDTYVDRKATSKTLKANAPHFGVQVYDHALHEIDNEIEEVASDFRQRTIHFLNSVVIRKSR